MHLTPAWLRAVAAISCVILFPVTASAAERMNDKAVAQQGLQIKVGFEAWKKALERKRFDDAVVRGAAGTIDVKEFLKGFAKDIDAFNVRFRSTKSAAPEALALLRRASDVERRVREQGGISTPGEWAALSTQCRTLAAAYGAVFPIESMDVTVNRATDKDVFTQLAGIGRYAKRVKGPADEAAKKAAGMDRAAREAMKLEIDSLARLADQVIARIYRGEPAVVQVSQLLAVAASARGTLAALDLPPAAKNDWSIVEHAAAAVAQAFGEPWGR